MESRKRDWLTNHLLSPTAEPFFRKDQEKGILKAGASQSPVWSTHQDQKPVAD